MRESALGRVEKATPGSDQLVEENRIPRPGGRSSPVENGPAPVLTTGRVSVAVARVAEDLWQKDAARKLADRTGQTTRAAERQLAVRRGHPGAREIGTEAFVALLRSDEGFAFLASTMEQVPAAARPGWWRKLVASQKRAELRRKQKQLADAIDDLTREEEQLALELRLGGPGEGGR